MATITTLSDKLIEMRKQETLDAQSIRKTVLFRDINLIDDKTIEYKGTRINISNQFFKSLLKLIGMSSQFANKFGNLFSAETKVAFINRIKNAMATNAGNLKEVTLAISSVNKIIIGITRKPTDIISNEQFLKLVEGIIDRQNFNVTNWSIDPTVNVIQINAFNPKATFSVKGLGDEVFTGGVTFRNSPLQGLQVLPYINRMWCANGLTASLAEEAYTLNSLDSITMEKFFERLNKLSKNNFAPEKFVDRVQKASSTPASLNEMRQAYSIIEKFAVEQADRWIPFNENLSAYKKCGFENMSTDQMRSAKSNQSVWSIVNGLTHFATHADKFITSDIEGYDQTKMMVQAGTIFGKDRFDHENNMPNPFNENILNEAVQVGSLLN